MNRILNSSFCLFQTEVDDFITEDLTIYNSIMIIRSTYIIPLQLCSGGLVFCDKSSFIHQTNISLEPMLIISVLGCGDKKRYLHFHRAHLYLRTHTCITRSLSVNSIDVKTAFKECLHSNMFYLHVPFSDQKFLIKIYICESKNITLPKEGVILASFER